MGETMDFCGRYQHQTAQDVNLILDTVYAVRLLALFQTTVFLDRSKLKAFADEKINVVEKLNFVSGRVENIVGKEQKLLFSHASAEVRGENTPGRKFASSGYRTHNHQVMSPTYSSLSHSGG